MTGVGKTSTVENTINPDGTYNTIKRTRTDTQLEATGGSNSAKQSEEVIITNNASSQLNEPGAVNAGTIKIHESEQLPNGLFRNVARTITAKNILVELLQMKCLRVLMVTSMHIQKP